MKAIQQFPLFLAMLCLLTGCRGIQSELQRSKLADAPAEMVIGDTPLRLEANLRRVYFGERFDLTGTIDVVSDTGTYPKGISVNHLTLRPISRLYYVMHFNRRNGYWAQAGVPANSEFAANFIAVTRNKLNRETIDFTWRNQGGGFSNKPEHFSAYDVSVTITDATGKRHVLALPAVPTK